MPNSESFAGAVFQEDVRCIQLQTPFPGEIIRFPKRIILVTNYLSVCGNMQPFTLYALPEKYDRGKFDSEKGLGMGHN